MEIKYDITDGLLICILAITCAIAPKGAGDWALI